MSFQASWPKPARGSSGFSTTIAEASASAMPKGHPRCIVADADFPTSSFWPRHARPGVLALESRFPPATVEDLKRRGHQVEVGEPWSEGRLSACAVEADGDERILKAGCNPRGMQGYAAGR